MHDEANDGEPEIDDDEEDEDEDEDDDKGNDEEQDDEGDIPALPPVSSSPNLGDYKQILCHYGN